MRQICSHKIFQYLLYPSNIEIKLGFDHVRNLLRQHCLSGLGEAYVDKIAFTSDFNVLQKLIAQTAEFLKVLQSGDAFPAHNFIDVTLHLENARIEGSVIDEKAFFEVKLSLQAVFQCLSFISKKEDSEIPCLKELAGPVSADKTLLKNIERVIDDNGTVRDTASPELQSIRRELIAEQSNLRKKLDSLLRSARSEGYAPEDASLTIRNGRMVIPVLAESKRKIKGFIHDESATGQTVFIEPVEVFDANNRIRELENDERREILRILTALTSELRQNLPELKKAFRFLGLVDFIRAKAAFASKIKASQQHIAKEAKLRWNNVFHPLLFLSHSSQGKPVVPLTIALDKEKRVLVISGPNAGGKSVMLKTVGLLQYMHQCGLLVPNGEQCTFGVFKEVFIDIGDEQSIDNDLSTYSSHLTNMREIVKHAGKFSLVLIDEFGTGTDPQYGGAIAESILEEMVKNQVFAVVNTHYSNLKYYAENTQGVVNGAMKYDYNELSPLYELEMGKPGNSFALEIAQKIGLPSQVINRAKNKIGDKKLNVDRLVKELQAEKEAFSKQNVELQKKHANLDATVKQYTELKEFIENNKNEAIHAARADAKRIVQEARHQSQLIIKHLKDASKYDVVEVELARESLHSIEKKLAPEPKPVAAKAKPADNQPLKVGDKVSVNGQDGTYKILTIKDKEAELVLGQLKTTVKLSRLTKSSGDKLIEESHPALKRVKGIDLQERMANFTSTIDLRGKRGEEALSLVDGFLDTALLVGSSNELRILHGKGDGILRKLIREHLKRAPFVESFKDEHMDHGGDGVTLVRLK